MDMNKRYYIIDNEPSLITFADLITENINDDVEALEEFEVVSLAKLKRNEELLFGQIVTIRRVI
tara:strand:- start:346 stop:537 length:192 start_codon:yes stop_codon:yes gene_type:complete